MSRSGPTLVHTESSLAWGGQEIRILTELRGLANLGWTVQLWAPDRSDLYRRARDAGIAAVPVRFGSSWDLPSICQIRRLIQKNSVDLIVTHSSIDSWVVGLATRAMARRPRLIRTRHLSTPVNHILPYRWFPAAICTTSRAISDGLIRRGIPAGKVRCIATGVDLTRFRPNPSKKSEMRKKYGLPEDQPLVGGVFVIRSWKGIYDFVKIALAVPGAHFVVAGGGPSRQAMMDTADQLGVRRRMSFIGHVEPVEEIFWSLDVFLFPSTANEGIPQAVLQAQACGIPAVVSGLPSIQEAAPRSVSCPPGSIEKFAVAIERLLADPAESKCVADAGLAEVQRFDQSEILREIDRYYRTVIQ